MAASGASGGSERKNQPKQHPLVEALVPDPSQPPVNSITIVGLRGRSATAGLLRLYLTAALNEYVEIAEDEVLYSVELPDDGGTQVWVNASSKVQHVRIESEQVQAEFLGGPIAEASYGPAGTAGPGGAAQAAPRPTITPNCRTLLGPGCPTWKPGLCPTVYCDPTYPGCQTWWCEPASVAPQCPTAPPNCGGLAAAAERRTVTPNCQTLLGPGCPTWKPGLCPSLVCDPTYLGCATYNCLPPG